MNNYKENDLLRREQRMPERTVLEDKLDEIDKGSTISVYDVNRMLNNIVLTEAQAKTLTSEVRDAEKTRFRYQSEVVYSDCLKNIYQGTTSAYEISQARNSARISEDQSTELLRVDSQSIRDRFALASNRVYFEVLKEINLNKTSPYDINRLRNFGRISEEQTVALSVLSREKTGVTFTLRSFEEYFRLLRDVYSGKTVAYEINSALSRNLINEEQAKRLQATLRQADSLPRQFKTSLTLALSNNFDEVDDYLDNFPIRDDVDVNTKLTYQEIANKTRFDSKAFEITRFIGRGDLKNAFLALNELSGTDNDTKKLRERLLKAADVLKNQVNEFRIFSLIGGEKLDFLEAYKVLEGLPQDSKSEKAIYKRCLFAVRTGELAENRRRVVGLLSPFEADYSKILDEIEGFPTRVEEDIKFKKDLKDYVLKLRRRRNVAKITTNFRTNRAETIISQISDLPEDTDEDIKAKMDLLSGYKKFIKVRKSSRPRDYDLLFEEEIEGVFKALNPGEFQKASEGINKEAFKYIKNRYRQSLRALVQTFREDPETEDEMARVVPEMKLAKNPGLEFRKRVRDFRKQRELTEIEEAYFKSVELLSAVAPHLIAVARADFGTTSVFLQNHFEELSKKTTKLIKDGDYFPLILVGTGPNGLIALGEIVRKNPALASQMLVIDQGKQPGGPFAIPNGPAWDLNSANLVGKKSLPDAILKNEDKTVRAYGSPDRWYPGERTGINGDTRTGSINKLIDWLPDPDDLSNRRYPTNEELQVMLALHASVVADKLALNTKLNLVAPFDNPQVKGNKLVVMTIKENDGIERIVQVKTDAIIVASGLGEPSYGFNIKGKRAEGVIRESSLQKGLPKVSTTLEAFGALADRARKKPTEGFGETIAIYGIGNSTDTLIEYLGRIFGGENTDVRKVSKIYVVATGAPTRRPRYAQINDLRPRLGKGNLIETVNGRVGDFDFDNRSLPFDERKVVLFDDKGQPLRNDEGEVLKVDNLIAATGFRPELDKVFDGYTPNDKRLREVVKPFSLPTNPQISVGEVLPTDSSVLFIGTASNPRFNEEKLLQLPTSSRDALIRVGPENAVAIGFRGPDTQAAIKVFLESNTFDTELNLKDRQENIDLGMIKEDLEPGQIVIKSDIDDLRIQDNADERRVLSSLLAYLYNNVEVTRESSLFSGQLQYQLTYQGDTNIFTIEPLTTTENPFAASDAFLADLTVKIQNNYFEQYALSVLKKSRGTKPSLRINFGFNDGKVDIGNTFVS